MRLQDINSVEDLSKYYGVELTEKISEDCFYINYNTFKLAKEYDEEKRLFLGDISLGWNMLAFKDSPTYYDEMIRKQITAIKLLDNPLYKALIEVKL